MEFMEWKKKLEEDGKPPQKIREQAFINELYLGKALKILNDIVENRNIEIKEVEDVLSRFKERYLIHRGAYFGTGDAWEEWYWKVTPIPPHIWIHPPYEGSPTRGDFVEVYTTNYTGEWILIMVNDYYGKRRVYKKIEGNLLEQLKKKGIEIGEEK